MMQVFTLYVGQPDQPDLSEHEVVAPSLAPAGRHITGMIVEAARERLLELYGPRVEVRIVMNRTAGRVLFTSGWGGFRPIPVDLSRFPNVPDAANWPDPYSVLIDLMSDVRDDLNDESYLDYILQEG